VKKIDRDYEAEETVAEWVESFWTRMRAEQGDEYYSDREFASQLLNWYVFHCSTFELSVRALKFVLAHKADLHSAFEKSIAGRLLMGDGPELYKTIPELRPVVEQMLWDVAPWMHRDDPDARTGEYSDFTWTDTRRALNIILWVEDVSFIGDLDRLRFLFEHKYVKPDDRIPQLERATHLVQIRELRRILDRLKKRQIADRVRAQIAEAQRAG
jgi:hypothetical protein